MTVDAKRRAVRLLGLTAEVLSVAAYLEGIRALLAFSQIAGTSPIDSLQAPIWWIASWSCLRFSLGFAALLVAKPALWFLPIVVGLWELKIFIGSIATTTRAMANFADVLEKFDFATLFPVFGHFWVACLAPLILIPTLGLQAWWLFAERERRHAV